MPILGRFKEVEVLIVDPKSRTQLSDIGKYIEAYGVESSVTTQSSGKEDAGAVILDEARHADLLVMGAYGFSTTMERWFGGVTESIKTECQTPVLFAHKLRRQARGLCKPCLSHLIKEMQALAGKGQMNLLASLIGDFVIYPNG